MKQCKDAFIIQLYKDAVLKKCLHIQISSILGKRPYGVSLLYMGWDRQYGLQLYQSDPSGNYGGWKATCIGNNSQVKLLGFLKPAKAAHIY